MTCARRCSNGWSPMSGAIRMRPRWKPCRSRLPDWEQHHHSDSIQYLIDRFIATIKRREAQELVVELAGCRDDPERAEKIDMLFLEASRKLATIVPSSRVERFSNMQERVERYREERTGKKQIGIPFGFPTLDEKTGGIQPHEFVAVAGFSGMGKSTLCSWILAEHLRKWLYAAADLLGDGVANDPAPSRLDGRQPRLQLHETSSA